MSLIILLVLLLLFFGGGSYYAPGRQYGYGLGGIVLVAFVVLWLTGSIHL